MPGVANSSEMAQNVDWGIRKLEVESVYELAKFPMKSLPQRYLRSDEERGIISIADESEIPLIDMSLLSHDDSYIRDEQIRRLCNACEEWGFFHLINHGIPLDLLDDIKRLGKQFFDLPVEEKQKISAGRRTDMQGYGQTYVLADQTKRDWGDLLGLIVSPAALRDSDAWPTKPRELRSTVERYWLEMMRVAQSLLGWMGLGLGLSMGYMPERFGMRGRVGKWETYAKVRMNMYPKCEWAEKVNGLSPHADMTGITMLAQEEDEIGLHVLRNGEWIGVSPVRGGLVVNVGNVMEVLSNGKFKSVVHRAVPNKRSPRISIPIFVAPPLDSVISPAPELGAPVFRSFIHREYIDFYSSRPVESKASFYQFASLPSPTLSFP